MLSLDAENKYDQRLSGGTSLVNSDCADGFSIILSSFGGSNNSSGTSSFSNLGRIRVNGVPHPTKNNDKHATRINLMLQAPSSMANQADQYLVHASHFLHQFYD